MVANAKKNTALVEAGLTLTSNTTYYAIWGVTVTFHGNKPGAATSVSVKGSTTEYKQVYDINHELTTNQIPTSTDVVLDTSHKDDYTFLGWGSQSTSKKANVISTIPASVTQNVDYYAVWGVTITFSANAPSGVTAPTLSGTGATAQTYDIGTQLSSGTQVPTATAGGSYTFAGWSTSATCDPNNTSTSGTPLYTAAQVKALTQNTNKTYYAIWYVTVTYNANRTQSGVSTAAINGNETEQYKVQVGGTLNTNNIPADYTVKAVTGTTTNATFADWNTSSDAQFDAVSDSSKRKLNKLNGTTITADTTYFAIWSVTVTLNRASVRGVTSATYKMNESTSSTPISIPITAGRTLNDKASSVPADAKQTATDNSIKGIGFVGWNTSSGKDTGTLRTDLLKIKVSADTSYYTSWRYYVLDKTKFHTACQAIASANPTSLSVVTGSTGSKGSKVQVSGKNYEIQGSAGSSPLYLWRNGTSLYVAPEYSDSLVVNSPEDCSYLFNTNAYYDQNTGIKTLQTLDLSSFSTATAKGNISSMFRENAALTTLTFGSNFNTKGITNMEYMFYACSELTGIDLSEFDTSNVTTMEYMFSNCSKLTGIDLSEFDTSNVTTMAGMFTDCSKLTGIDLSEFDTSNVTTMAGMFYKCTSLTSIDLSNFNTSKVTSYYAMFSNCKTIKTISLRNFTLNSSANIGSMFTQCPALEHIYATFDASSLSGNASLTRWNNVFDGCSKLPGYSSSKKSGDYAKPKSSGGYFEP